MAPNFTAKIAPHVEAELADARRACSANQATREFLHLERAHVPGQESSDLRINTYYGTPEYAVKVQIYIP
ncbi:DUF3703 domain-containing protein [Haliea sp. E1-2-M8]|uniref:DUF3703 domain-containing protein n=1 Tax=Haliea sp. E1-2-M8 TaxID=3064706 RepID=UPI00351BECAE